MDSLEFLSFARKINQSNPLTEIDCRQVVSRSYYCAFHKTSEKALSLGVPIKAYKGGTHMSLRETLVSLRPANNKLKGVAFRLNNFHALRVEADYNLNTAVTTKSADESIQICEKIISELALVTSL